ncbi:hypothetical protein [Dyadobacter arcticus]|uniref:Carboxypeptidase regulatory-like domain-containing protein n=1 Tax=Dyadobacter arcticus TaxID=1078754 RepID=A0ABX0UPY2_9BACT|nr:hypothetical protein [Dyadobacter arcticus]NIJ53076.1 hypothetical protein [Dyadobacter arcticus]
MTLSKLVFGIMLMVALASCGPLLNRVTVVYGLITDEDGQPVDSVLVEMYGGRAISVSGSIGEAYSNKQGFYEIEVDVSHEWWVAKVGIPFYSFENKKPLKPFKSYESTRNQTKPSSGESGLTMGLRTRCDFKLIRK